MEIFETDSDIIVFIKMALAVVTLIITGYSIISGGMTLLKTRKKKMGFRKD